MQNIPITLAAAGMVLARDITRPDKPDGPPICGKGLVLSDSLLDRLRNMGIQSVAVEGRPVTLEGEATIEEALEALDRRFRKSKGDPATMKLRDIYRTHIMRAMGG